MFTITTVLFVGTFVALLIAQLAASAVFLQWGACWVKVPNIGFGRALGAFVVISLVNGIVSAIFGLAPTGGRELAVFLPVLQLVLMLGLSWSIIARMLKTRLWQAIVAWLATLIPTLGLFLLVICVVRPYWFEAFTVPTNSMAPTLLGLHWEATCPRCGSPAFCTPEPNDAAASNRLVTMICSREQKSCEVADPSRVEHSGDRFAVAKFLRPQRWDVIVFRLPSDPKTFYCKRLIGLPGETVTIKDGAVWIDGKRQTPPDSCREIEYLDRIEGLQNDPIWGSEAKPAKLGPDEYFVFGRFLGEGQGFPPMESRRAGPSALCRSRFVHRGRGDAYLLAAQPMAHAAIAYYPSAFSGVCSNNSKSTLSGSMPSACASKLSTTR